MASFQVKLGWKRLRLRENKNYRSVSFLQNVQQKITKKQEKKFKKLKNTIMSSFQPKIGWKTQTKRENKNYRSVTFLPGGLEEIPKKQQKNIKIPLWHHFEPKQVGKG